MTTSKRKPITENAWLLKRLEEWHAILQRKPDYQFTDQQQLILEYWRLPEKTDKDLGKLAALVRAERAHENALAAKKRADKIVQERKAAERKARNKRCFDAAALMMKAGLVDSKTAELTMPADQLLDGLVRIAEPPPADEFYDLLVKAGLTNVPADQLLGGLLAVASVTDPATLQQWSEAGAAALAPEPEPQPEPDPLLPGQGHGAPQ